MGLHITKTFVAVADDCPAVSGIIPSPKGGKATVAVLEYELLSAHPYRYTREDLIFEVHLARGEISEQERKARGGEIRAELFARSHACMRASPLTKSYGWGAHYDEAGRLAIYPRESPQYRRLSRANDLDVVKAMRNKRA
jgi:Family of unknown function (DUF6157)